MKKIVITLLLMGVIATPAKDNRVLIPPFENLSSRRAPAEYDISAGGLSERVPTHNMVDRYSHIPREILEDIVSQIKGVRPVERQRLDQFFWENGLDSARTFVEGEKAKNAMIQLKTPTAVQGTILTVYDEVSDYDGYVHIRTHRWTSLVRVRIYHLVGGSLQIPYSRLLTGRHTIIDAPGARSGAPDIEIALGVLSDALEQLRGDQGFSAAIQEGRPPAEIEEGDDGLVKIPFDVTPDGSNIYIDDEWQGKTPCILRLRIGKQVVVRIEKRPSYQPWQVKITPRVGFRVSQDLELAASGAEKGSR